MQHAVLTPPNLLSGVPLTLHIVLRVTAASDAQGLVSDVVGTVSWDFPSSMEKRSRMATCAFVNCVTIRI